jgi:hypothetical protein
MSTENTQNAYTQNEATEYSNCGNRVRILKSSGTQNADTEQEQQEQQEQIEHTQPAAAKPKRKPKPDWKLNAGFVEFWNAYPVLRHDDAAGCCRIWESLPESERERATAHVKSQVDSGAWDSETQVGQFACACLKYLKNERWKAAGQKPRPKSASTGRDVSKYEHPEIFYGENGEELTKEEFDALN